ncbi:hypothetical protein K438DRAFT_2055212 [Mycena galopus ATCC 62051]|nr:hypothetical protein K438DRAFT_2055212 [Mycena galopus ATCC 62051]
MPTSRSSRPACAPLTWSTTPKSPATPWRMRTVSSARAEPPLMLRCDSCMKTPGSVSYAISSPSRLFLCSSASASPAQTCSQYSFAGSGPRCEWGRIYQLS